MKQYLSEISIYTDGSCHKIGGHLNCGYGVHFIDNILPDISAEFIDKDKTNNRAELYAILVGIKVINKNFTFDKLSIYTDSEYSQKSLTVWLTSWKKNGWINSKKKPVENQDIIKQIDIYLQKYINKIDILWIRSHTNKHDMHSINNAIADKLANDGALWKCKNNLCIF